MEIFINYKYDISPNKLFILVSIFLNKDMEKICENYDIDYEREMSELHSLGLVDNSSPRKLTDEGVKHVSHISTEKNFREVWEAYPSEVGMFGQKRKLRNGKDKCKLIYTTKVKTEKDHEKVMKGLNNEVKFRKENKSLAFMQNLQTWLRQETWETYIDEINNDGEQGRITTVL